MLNHGLTESLSKIVSRGSLRVVFSTGTPLLFGDGSGIACEIRFADRIAEARVALDPALALGEMYMDGRLQVTKGSVYDLLSILKRNGLRKGATASAIMLQGLRTAASYGRGQLSPSLSKRNVAHHYDLDSRLFKLFLDDDLQYSCAYFEHAGQSLEAAQLAKKRRLAAKLDLRPGHRVVDIGCGWGGLSMYLASVARSQVTGVTLSEEQLAVAQSRAAERGLASSAQFRLQDYRHVQGEFDRIVSVGMFEHVGLQAYDAFFETAARLMQRKGVFVLHSIGRTRPLRAPSPFVDKYIFPHCYIPALSEVLPSVERAGFIVRDMEVLPLHYADTLRLWRKRFLQRKHDVLKLYDERFVRMWEFYLAASEVAFRHDRMFVFQLQLIRHQDALPTTRDWMQSRLAELRARELEVPAYSQLTGPNAAVG